MIDNSSEFESGYFPEGTTHEDEFFYLDELNFVWDRAKNERNIKDHGIDFRTAALVFNDPYALTDWDDRHSDSEDRHTETGVPVDLKDVLDVPGFEDIPRAFLGEVDNVLVVVYTMRFIRKTEFYRIISARVAEDDEIRAYKSARFTREEM